MIRTMCAHCSMARAASTSSSFGESDSSNWQSSASSARNRPGAPASGRPASFDGAGETPAVRMAGSAVRGRRAGGVDLVAPGGDDACLDIGELVCGVVQRVAGLVDVGPGGADVRLGVDRVALPAVRLITGVGVFDINAGVRRTSSALR